MQQEPIHPRGTAMRAVECPCGEHLEGATDAEVLEATKRHATEEHEGQYTDIDLKLLVDTSAYDTGT
jgi:predicted small metal-binding protein